MTGFRVLALAGTLALVGLAAVAPPPGDDWSVPQWMIFGAVLLGGILWPYIDRCESEGGDVEAGAADSRPRILRGLLWRLAAWAGSVYLAGAIYESVLRSPNVRGTFIILLAWCTWGWIGETWRRAREGSPARRCLETPTVPSRRA